MLKYYLYAYSHGNKDTAIAGNKYPEKAHVQIISAITKLTYLFKK